MSKNSSNHLDQVIPDIEQWPIYKLHHDRRKFVEEIEEFTFNRIWSKSPGAVSDILSKTIYLEKIRIKEEPWKVDPPNEPQFWRRISKRLVRKSLDRSEEESIKTNEEILRKIIHRYAEEIVGTFRKQTFLFARKFLTLFFTRLLNTAAAKRWHRIWSSRFRLADRLKVTGEVDTIRELFKKGTVVIVPTHFSNLDSILIGFAMDTFVGLPSFSYGAGLNLYNTGYTAYFMNRLGAYRVDRRKKNPIYLETLKAMSNLSIQRGTNSLFFPGGTRSRSGALETNLKLGLLSTAIEAQEKLLKRGKEDKIFIVPLVTSYHFVLEAKYLIDQHLRIMGKERYIRSKDAFNSFRQIIKFVWQLFSKGNEIILSIGQPMDVLGNPVNADGRSFDKYGNEIKIKDYFVSNGIVNENLQRESEYTKILADKIVERYHRDNIVLTSHLVAFAAFQLLKYQNPKLDLYGILRLPTDDYVFSKSLLFEVIEELRDHLLEMAAKDQIKLSEQMHWELDQLIKDGISRLGNYHVAKALKFNKNGEIISDSFKILFYYHNRLENYNLDDQIKWKKLEMELEEI
ncbi:MAG: hypothetical protein DHS20C18_15520 [Saprospiraceae bacterium]|nr:MAG: hypothetical protein DHS20C18_15520 [Saprospiraceae bacterium]